MTVYRIIIGSQFGLVEFISFAHQHDALILSVVRIDDHQFVVHYSSLEELKEH